VGTVEGEIRDRVRRCAAKPDIHVILLGSDQVREPVGIDIARVRRVDEMLVHPGTADREISGRIEHRPSEPDVDAAGIEAMSRLPGAVANTSGCPSPFMSPALPTTEPS